MERESAQSVYNEYTRNGNGQSSRPKHVYLAALREHYPNHFVVSVDPQNAEFLDFADAGHATAVLDTAGNHIAAVRNFIAPNGNRESAKDAKLSTDVYFGRYNYTWEKKTFLLYKTSWETYYGADVYWYYVLYPKAAGAETDHGTTSCPEIDEFLLELGRWTAVPHKDIYVFDGGYYGYHRSRSTWESIKNANWDDVVMDPITKDLIMKDTTSFFSPTTRELFAKYKLPYKRGILLHGAPGNGKTITIKALIAHLMNQPDPIPTFYVKSTTDKSNGAEVSIHRIFKQARKIAPCALVFEDLDSMVTDQTRSYFLNEVDGLGSNDGILMIASTNHLEKIDEAIRSRPSRFDRKYGFDLPSRTDRVRYAEHWRRKLASNDDIEFPSELCEVIADLTPEYSYAYLKEVFVSSLMVAARRAAGEEEDWDFIGPESAIHSDKGDDTPKTENDAPKTKGEGIKAEKEVKPKNLQLLDVKISDELKKNEFFKIVHQQVGILTTEKEAKKKVEEKKKTESWFKRLIQTLIVQPALFMLGK